MSIRNTTATLLFSTLLLAAGTGLAAAQTAGAGQSFESQLSEAADAVRNHLPGGAGLEERLTVEHHLQIARDLSRQGQIDAAQSYLNFARGELGLSVSPRATEVTAMPSQFSAKDFNNSVH